MTTYSTTVPPQVSSGFARRRHTILAGYVFLTVVYLSVFYALKDSGAYLVPAEEFCIDETQKLCSRPDLFAFQVSSGLALGYAGMLGFIAWHITRRVHAVFPQTPEGRLFGYMDESERLAAANFSFQTWDFVVSLFIPEHRTIIMLSHHILAGTVGWFSLQYQYLQYYGVYFLGVTEFSSIFLAVIDLGRYFPTTPGSYFDFVVKICQPLFVISFAYYRVFRWWTVSLRLWSDAHHVLSKNIAEQYRPGKSYGLHVFLIINLLLGVLQLYWFYLILLESGKVLGFL